MRFYLRCLLDLMYAHRYTTLQATLFADGNEWFNPCVVLLSQALCDVSRIGALGLSSVLARFAYGHIHTALFNCQGTDNLWGQLSNMQNTLWG